MPMSAHLFCNSSTPLCHNPPHSQHCRLPCMVNTSDTYHIRQPLRSLAHTRSIFVSSCSLCHDKSAYGQEATHRGADVAGLHRLQAEETESESISTDFLSFRFENTHRGPNPSLLTDNDVSVMPKPQDARTVTERTEVSVRPLRLKTRPYSR